MTYAFADGRTARRPVLPILTPGLGPFCALGVAQFRELCSNARAKFDSDEIA
jgi:hypothetical protein